MKRHIANVGSKKWFSDHFLDLQHEPLKAIDMALSVFGACVISGCEITSDGASAYDVSSGMAIIKDDEGNYKAVPFEGDESIDPAVKKYLKIEKTSVTGQYENPVDNTIAYDYKAVLSTTPPSEGVENEDFVEIQNLGSGTYKLRNHTDAKEAYLNNIDKYYVSSGEKSTWNSKAAGSHGHSPSDISETSSSQFVSASEKSTWNSKADGDHTHTQISGLIVEYVEIGDWDMRNTSSRTKILNTSFYATSTIVSVTIVIQNDLGQPQHYDSSDLSWIVSNETSSPYLPQIEFSRNPSGKFAGVDFENSANDNRGYILIFRKP